MASPSSSMSQESLDHEEGDDGFTNRAKSRNIRLLRARGALRTDRDNGDSYDTRDSTVQNGDTGEGEGCGGGSSVIADHDSAASRSLASRDRPKDKRTRPNHLQRGKLPKDKRKLREKRRSTGVVHLQSTEVGGNKFLSRWFIHSCLPLNTRCLQVHVMPFAICYHVELLVSLEFFLL